MLKTRRARSTGDLSLGMFLIFTAGVLLWLIYGLLLNAIALIAANGVTFVLSALILAFKLRYG